MLEKTLKNLLAAAAPLLAALCAGCGPYWVDPYITVRESPLNWIEIHYYNTYHKPILRTAVYLNGAGYVELKKGTSELVSNDFAKKYDSATWENIKTQRVHTSPAHAKDLMQTLVNHGVLDTDKFGRGTDTPSDRIKRFIAVKANINNYTYSERQNIFEVDPDLAELLLDVVREFDNPTL